MSLSRKDREQYEFILKRRFDRTYKQYSDKVNEDKKVITERNKKKIGADKIESKVQALKKTKDDLNIKLEKVESEARFLESQLYILLSRDGSYQDNDDTGFGKKVLEELDKKESSKKLKSIKAKFDLLVEDFYLVDTSDGIKEIFKRLEKLA